MEDLNEDFNKSISEYLRTAGKDLEIVITGLLADSFHRPPLH